MNSNIRIINTPEEIKNTKKRKCFQNVCNFIEEKRCLNGKILALYGLRRTGKTFLLSQVKEKYGENVEHLEFPLINKNKEPITFVMEDVYEAIDECIEKGKTIILLDEITNVEDFTYDSAILADYYAKKGISIIIAGTDSLSLILAGNDTLLGRKPEISMTYISFTEHCDVLSINDIDDYIMYGGLMHEGIKEDDDMVKDITTKQRYLDSAVSSNITKSLKRYAKYSNKITHFEEIKKYEDGDIQQIINKLVEDYSGVFDETKINNKTIHNIIDYPIKKCRKQFGKSVAEQIKNNRKKNNDDYANKINIACNLSKPATSELINELEKALVILGVVSSLNIHKYERIEGGWSNAKDYKETHIIQPAIKFYQLKEAQKIYLETADLSHMKYSDREFLAKKLEEKIFGDMTKNIVCFDTKNSIDSDKYLVCKPEFSIDGKNVGEYDMLIFDKENISYYGFEIKHSSKACLEQYKNLKNEELSEVLNYQYGDRKNVSVLYRGKSFKSADGVFYLNIKDFLQNIDKTHNIEKTMKELTKNLKEYKVYPGIE